MTICHYLWLSKTIYLCLWLSLSLSLSVSICIYLYLSVSICIYLYLSVSVCIYLYLSVSICIYLYLSVSICIYLSIFLLFCRSFFLSFFLSIFLSIYPSIHSSVHPFIRSFIHSSLSLSLSSHLSIYLAINAYQPSLSQWSKFSQINSWIKGSRHERPPNQPLWPFSPSCSPRVELRHGPHSPSDCRQHGQWRGSAAVYSNNQWTRHKPPSENSIFFKCVNLRFPPPSDYPNHLTPQPNQPPGPGMLLGYEAMNHSQLKKWCNGPQSPQQNLIPMPFWGHPSPSSTCAKIKRLGTKSATAGYGSWSRKLRKKVTSPGSTWPIWSWQDSWNLGLMWHCHCLVLTFSLAMWHPDF